MGMYDSVYVPCPNCGELTEFQSKGGKCTLASYTLENVPDGVLRDINRHSPYTCAACETKFSVRVTTNNSPTYRVGLSYVRDSVRSIYVEYD